METDLKLFHDFEKGLISSTLRIYSWKPKCISLGYAQKMERLIDGEMVRKLGWDVVKRPTGGGIVFHNEAEVTYSLVTELNNPVLPGGMIPSYRRISEAIVCGLRRIGLQVEISNQAKGQRPKAEGKRFLCFSYPAEYEIVVEGPSTSLDEARDESLGARKKIVGSAQKRGKRTLLQQGSIFVKNTTNGDFSVLKNTYGSQNAVSVEEVLGRKIDFEELSGVLTEGFEERLGIKFKT
jgi:lipoate-protein ligase A